MAGVFARISYKIILLSLAQAPRMLVSIWLNLTVCTESTPQSNCFTGWVLPESQRRTLPSPQVAKLL